MTGSTQHAKDVTSKANKMVNGEKPSFFSRFRKSKPNIVTKFNEKPIPQTVDASDPTSLAVPDTVSPNVYLTAAAVSEHQGATDKAIAQYQKLLKIAPNHRQGLIRLARVLHSNGRMQESIETYQRAVAAYPTDAVILNDLGLCLARNGQHQEAVAAIQKAQQLDPKNTMYGNNLAAVLVESHRVEDAIGVLTQKHGPAIAHYNVGYMLNQQGDTAAATEHFATSLRYDPNLQQAQQMLDRMTPMVSRRTSNPNRDFQPNPVSQQQRQTTEQSFYYPETQQNDADYETQPDSADFYGNPQVQVDSAVPSESYVATDLPLGLEGEPAPIVNAASLKKESSEVAVPSQLVAETPSKAPQLIGEFTHKVARAIDQLTDESDAVVPTAHLEPVSASIALPSQLKIVGQDKSEAIEPPLPMEWK